MGCEKSIELVAYVKGELEEPERLETARHVEVCSICSAELARSRAVLSQVSTVGDVEPSAHFARRVTQALVKAHPELVEERISWWEALKLRLGFIPAWSLSVAAHVALLAIATLLFFAPGPKRQKEETSYLPRMLFDPPADLDKSKTPHVEWRTEDRHREAELWDDRLKKDNEALGKLEARSDERMKVQLRSRFGVEGAAESIHSGLVWLEKNQDRLGYWDSETCGGERGYTVGLTGLAVLAFLGDGHTHKSGPHAEAVKRGLWYLVDEQRPSGLIGGEEGNYMYNHALAAQALLEAYIMTRDPWLQGPVSSAVSFAISSQSSDGGWGYTSRASESDTSIGGWTVFFLRLASATGEKAAVPSLRLARHRLESLTSPESGKVGYRERGQFPNGPLALTAAGMLAAEMCSLLPDPEVLGRQTDLIEKVDAIRSTSAQDYQNNDLYYAYFATLALFQRGGESWSAWSHRLFPALLKAQAADGSWPKYFDKWAHYGGQVYTTAMGCLILESTHRYPQLGR